MQGESCVFLHWVIPSHVGLSYCIPLFLPLLSALHCTPVSFVFSSCNQSTIASVQSILYGTQHLILASKENSVFICLECSWSFGGPRYLLNSPPTPHFELICFLLFNFLHCPTFTSMHCKSKFYCTAYWELNTTDTLYEVAANIWQYLACNCQYLLISYRLFAIVLSTFCANYIHLTYQETSPWISREQTNPKLSEMWPQILIPKFKYKTFKWNFKIKMWIVKFEK